MTTLSGVCAGDLRHFVEVQERTDVPDSSGGRARTWVKFADVWCAIKQLSGKELKQYEQLNEVKMKKFVTRYYEGINEKMRLVYHNKEFNIRNVDNLEERNEWLVIMAEEGVVT